MFSLKSFLFSGCFPSLPPNAQPLAFNWSHRTFLFWSALPILREAHCAWSMARFQHNCSTFSCFGDRTWVWIKYNFLRLHFPGVHPKWPRTGAPSSPLVSFCELLSVKGQGHHYRCREFAQCSRMLVLEQNFLSLWPALCQALTAGRTEFLHTSVGHDPQTAFPTFCSKPYLPFFNGPSTWSGRL